jgi:hypothetical protein
VKELVSQWSQTATTWLVIIATGIFTLGYTVSEFRTFHVRSDEWNYAQDAELEDQDGRIVAVEKLAHPPEG